MFHEAWFYLNRPSHDWVCCLRPVPAMQFISYVFVLLCWNQRDNLQINKFKKDFVQLISSTGRAFKSPMGPYIYVYISCLCQGGKGGRRRCLNHVLRWILVTNHQFTLDRMLPNVPMANLLFSPLTLNVLTVEHQAYYIRYQYHCLAKAVLVSFATSQKVVTTHRKFMKNFMFQAE